MKLYEPLKKIGAPAIALFTMLGIYACNESPTAPEKVTSDSINFTQDSVFVRDELSDSVFMVPKITVSSDYGLDTVYIQRPCLSENMARRAIPTDGATSYSIVFDEKDCVFQTRSVTVGAQDPNGKKFEDFTFHKGYFRGR